MSSTRRLTTAEFHVDSSAITTVRVSGEPIKVFHRKRNEAVNYIFSHPLVKNSTVVIYAEEKYTGTLLNFSAAHYAQKNRITMCIRDIKEETVMEHTHHAESFRQYRRSMHNCVETPRDDTTDIGKSIMKIMKQSARINVESEAECHEEYAIYTDASLNMNSGVSSVACYDTTGEVSFSIIKKKVQIEKRIQNMEALAVILALGRCNDKSTKYTIYSDSRDIVDYVNIKDKTQKQLQSVDKNVAEALMSSLHRVEQQGCVVNICHVLGHKKSPHKNHKIGNSVADAVAGHVRRTYERRKRSANIEDITTSDAIHNIIKSITVNS